MTREKQVQDLLERSKVDYCRQDIIYLYPSIEKDKRISWEKKCKLLSLLNSALFINELRLNKTIVESEIYYNDFVENNHFYDEEVVNQFYEEYVLKLKETWEVEEVKKEEFVEEPKTQLEYKVVNINSNRLKFFTSKYYLRSCLLMGEYEFKNNELKECTLEDFEFFKFNNEKYEWEILSIEEVKSILTLDLEELEEPVQEVEESELELKETIDNIIPVYHQLKNETKEQLDVTYQTLLEQVTRKYLISKLSQYEKFAIKPNCYSKLVDTGCEVTFYSTYHFVDLHITVKVNSLGMIYVDEIEMFLKGESRTFDYFDEFIDFVKELE